MNCHNRVWIQPVDATQLNPVLAEEVLQMNQRLRICYTESQQKLMWYHSQKGDSLQQIAQLFNRNHSSIQRILAETGGIRPAVGRRSRLALTLPERKEISRAVVAGNSIRSMAALLGRAASTISREIRRNGGQGSYRANRADQVDGRGFPARRGQRNVFVQVAQAAQF